MGRPLPFVLAATDQGALIVSRFDRRVLPDGHGYGVGFQLLETGAYDAAEAALGANLLACRRRYFGDGVVALDCGANIGVFTVAWARVMTGWGSVVAIEAQERLFYALAGNIALANCFNARAIHAAVDATAGPLQIPVPDYLSGGSLGSLELRDGPAREFIGQPVDYAPEVLVGVPAVSVDSLALPRLDLLKLDVEGMECAALAGAEGTIGRCLPIVVAEHIKAGAGALRAMLESHGYRCHDVGADLVAIHSSDPTAGHVQTGVPN